MMKIDTTHLKLVRLVSGEELVANVSRETDVSITLHKPIKVIHIPLLDGSATILVVKFTTLSDDDWVLIPRSHILTMMNPNEDAIEYFRISLRREYEVWAEENAVKEQASKDFKELEAIANEVDAEGSAPDDPETGKCKKPKKKKLLVN